MEDNTEQPPSLSQLLRVSYVAEARAQHRHSETSRSDASPSRLQIYGSLRGKGEEAVGHNDAQFPDLSAFLSQEELDKSVNLARQAIGHETLEQTGDVKVLVKPVTTSTSDSINHLSSASVSLSTPSAVPVSDHSPASFSAPPASTSTLLTSDKKMHNRQDNMVRNSVDGTEAYKERNSSARGTPYGPETQSKKEFLNKAADFIEELSSLFKANSSKRVRPRTCKAHRSRNQSKSQTDDVVYPISSDSRERTIRPVEMEQEKPTPAVVNQPVVDQDLGSLEFQDSGVPKEEQFDSVTQEIGDVDERLVLTESPHQGESACEPPHFIQKLKSREVPEGTKVQLDCIVRGYPVPEVRWFCEGKELENSPDIQIITDGELHSLIIAEAFEEDTGRYSCFASNVYGTDSTSAEIYVEGASSSDSEAEQCFEHVAQLQRKPAKSSPSLPQPSNQTPPAKEGGSAAPPPAAPPAQPQEELSLEHTLTAPQVSLPVRTSAIILQVPELSKVSLVPPAEEEQTVLPEQVFPTSAGGTEHTETQSASAAVPVLSALQLEQAAEATSTAPPVSSILSPAAQTSHLQTSTISQHHLEEINEQPVMAAPVFTKSLQDLSASEGQLVVLESRVRGVPSPRVNWYREGKLIEDSPDFRILQKKPRSPMESEEICTLVIAEVFPEDSGMFTCTANNNYGTVSSTAALRVQANGSSSSHARPFSGLQSESRRSQELTPSGVNCQPEVTVSGSIKPHASTVRLEPLVSSTLRLEPLNTSTLRLEPSILNLSAASVHRELQGPSGAHHDHQSQRQIFSSQRPFTVSPAVVNTSEQKAPGPSDRGPHAKAALTPPNGSSGVVPLPDPPPNSCLKTGTLTNHRDSRSSSRVGLRVHFKLPEDEEDEQGDTSHNSDEDLNLELSSKEPPPVLAKPKLDPAQLQLLHNQVLMEQQQENEPHAKPQSQPPFQVQGPIESQLWSARTHREPQGSSFQSHHVPPSAAPLSSTAPPAPSFSSPPALSSSSWTPPPFPHLSTPPLVGQTNTFHSSHLNLSPAAVSRAAPKVSFSSPPAPKLSTVPSDSASTLLQITSPTPQLRSTHASLMNLTAVSFNYTRPKEFIAAQTFSPVRSPSPTESPVPLLQELAAGLNSSATSSPIPPPFSPPLRFSPTRILKSPTSPPSNLSSPTPGQGPFLNSTPGLRAQSPPQASSPTSSTSSPSPIQNPVAFLSSVLPSLTPSQPTNSMGLPKGAPSGVRKKTPKTRLPSTGGIHESKEILLQDIQKKLRFKTEAPQLVHQQKLSNQGKTASRLLGPNIAATVINYDEEYKVSNFEQRLMSEIEFRLERTPVEESDDEVQHDDIPTGKCIAPLFDKKLKNYKAMEGVPVTFSCKVLGVPPPKVYWFKDGKQILKKNTHYQKIREGDGTCSLHIESTTSDDDGNYTIMAANPQGRISCSGHLIIQSGPPQSRLTPIQSQRVRARIQEVEGEQTQERFFQPHFLQAPGDMTADEGRLCRLDCKVSGLPNPELMWLVNGRPIYPDFNHKMLVRENGIHSLVIDPVTQTDAGTYTCIASNKAGQSSFSLELKVVEKERKHPPQFLEKLQNMGIPEGAPVRLECRVAGMPPPAIFWKKDNETISKTKSRMSMNQDTTGYVCLLIHPTTKDDAGWYTVSAKNDAGVVSCTCRLDIYAQWHQSIPAPMRKAPRTSSRYAALTGQGLDIKSAFSTSDTSPILFASSPPESTLESEEL
ncbi:PREDICTED: myopalladin isoform X2 [Cyprinodon variegatus]|uniref:Myopalladin n=1 Tax=Cyprinodon variegatus TaxID=28743 RepID=A0A3Q2CH24_CYPVA|nr:PREDICTED: myopalladin isoform X1 [Cyprinodon variegatus]XP_015235568.1 PREDICTED: myopalladin isoform X2 [Cyprinodon variegatus]